MWLDLHEIIEVPGRSVPFSCTLQTERLSFPSVDSYDSAPAAEGVVKNTAGLLVLDGTIHAGMFCFCDRCGKRFHTHRDDSVHVLLTADPDSDDDSEAFPLEGDGIDVSDLLETVFILNTDSKFLCKEDCKGLCSTCGCDLNEGPCSCSKPVDPRWAVLGQLLDGQNK